MQIDKKIAVVTGASSGLGAALASALVGKGATVYALARNADKLNALQKKLSRALIPVQMDITDQKAISHWAKETFGEKHLPDILVNNAGVGYLKKMEELSLEEWHAMVNTNLNGTFYLTSSLAPLLKQNPRYCHIINIGSILGKTTTPASAAYSATKYAMQGFSEALFKELREYNIKVTCVNPGSIDTHFFEESDISSHSNMLQPKDIAALLVHLLETPDNMLVDEISLRPLNPKREVGTSKNADDASALKNTEHQMSSPVCYADSKGVRKEFREGKNPKDK